MRTIIERARGGLGVACLALLSMVPATQLLAQDADTPSYTAEQVEHGQWVFNNQCAVCHGETMFDIFASYETAERFYLFISGSMPRDMPGWLSEQEYIDIVAYLMDGVGFTAGEKALMPDREVLARIIPSEGAQN